VKEPSPLVKRIRELANKELEVREISNALHPDYTGQYPEWGKFHNRVKTEVSRHLSKQADKPHQPVDGRIVRNTTQSSEFHALKTELGLHSNEFNLPEPLDDEIVVHKLPTACNKILLLSDIHIPFHTKEALTTALKYGRDRGANTIYLNGDTIDFYAISRFQKEKRLRNLVLEIEMMREFIGIVGEVFPNAQRYLKIGNHCNRWATYISENAKEFDGVDDFEFGNVMRLNQNGWNIIADKDLMQMGGLFTCHGHEMYGGGGVNPSRSLFLKTMRSTLMSHVHRTSEYSGKDISGKFITCWSTGCLSQLRPKYNPLSQYNHGFAFVETQSNDDFHVDNLRIDNGKII